MSGITARMAAHRVVIVTPRWRIAATLRAPAGRTSDALVALAGPGALAEYLTPEDVTIAPLLALGREEHCARLLVPIREVVAVQALEEDGGTSDLTLRVLKRPHRCRLALGAFAVDGVLHLAPAGGAIEGTRWLESPFVPLTDATLTHLDLPTPIVAVGTVVVGTAHVTLAWPPTAG